MLLCIVMLSASATFAADDTALADASDEIAVEENVLTANNDFASESSNAILAEATDDNIVTNETFHNYFDEYGILLKNVTSDELIFEGDFSGLDVDYIIISNKSITLNGNDAFLEGISFVITSDDVTIDGFTMTQTADVAGIYAEGDNIVISNNFIDFTALEGYESYAINSFASSNLQLLNNTILYVGNTDGTVVNNAVRVYGDDEEETPATSIVVSGNTFEIELPSVDVGYDPDTWESVVMSEGIVFYYCEDLQFVDNAVNVKYNNHTSAYGIYDTLYAVSVRSDAYSFGEIQSSDVLIANNTIELEGYGCAYGIYLCADDFEIIGNDIDVTGEAYLAHGIDVDGPSANGAVVGNAIDAVSPMASYGVYSYAYMGAVEGLYVMENTIYADGYASAGIELKVADPVVTDNDIVVDGNYTYGIIASVIEDEDGGIISGNDITVSGSNVGDAKTGDSFMKQNSVGISVKGSSLIEDNTIKSTNIGIQLVEDGEFTINGNDIAVEANALIDSYGIYSKGLSNITITDNEIEFIGNTDGTVVNNALYVAGDDEEGTPATSIVVSGNIFTIELPSVDVGYDPDTWASKVMSEGIAFYYCEDLQFVDNAVNLEYNNHTSAYGIYDSLYAVSVKSDAYSFGEVQSSGILIANNTIELEGYGCAYGIYLCADEFEISGNGITVIADAYLAHGIDVDGPSANGTVVDNIIRAGSPMASYGVYSYAYMGAVEGLSVTNNFIYADGYASAGIELKVADPVVTDNIVLVDGNYTYGIIASVIEDEEGAVISGNNITIVGSNVGDAKTGDSFMKQNSVGISVKGSSLIEDNTIKSTNIGIELVEDGEFTINSNDIAVEANALIDSYGIYSHGLSNITIADNEIEFIGNTDGTVVNNAVRIEGDDEDDAPATSIVVSGNIFDIEMPSVDVGYDPDTWASTVMNDAIVFYYVEDLEFVGNDVKVKYNNVTTAYGYDSMYAVSVRSDAYSFGEVQSSDILIEDNTIELEGHACAYPVYVCADNFIIGDNSITATSETYLAHGIDVDGPSAVGQVYNNNIIAEAPLAAYGIYSYQYMGAIEDISYYNNTIDVTAYGSAGMEIVECNPTISGNEIIANGNYTYGIIASIRDEGIISDNTVVVLGSNEGSDATGDGLMPQNSMGISVKGTSLIEENTIESTNIGINLVEEGQITIDNNVINVEANTGEIDNHAIVASEIEELIISNNEISYVGASTPKDDYKTAKAYAIYVNGSEVHVENNTIDAVVPSLPADWEEVPPGSWNYVRHAYTEGLVFDGCDFSSVEGNDITLTYDEGSYGSIYVIDVLGCDDFIVADNTIDAAGESYIYGIIVEGDDFTIANNTISVSSENYACGIDIEESTGGIIDSNLIEAVAPESVYPIYGGMVGTPSVEITNNDIYGDSYFAVGIEFSGSDVTATDNTIELSGNHTIGIGVHVDELIAENNTIISEASNTGNVSIWDSLGTNTTGIKSTKGKAAIIDNEIKTTGKYSVEIDDLEGTVHDNYLVSEKLIGDKSVYSTGSASVYDNLPDMKVVLFASDLIKAYDDGQLFVVTAVDENGDPMVGIDLWAYVDDETWVGNTDEDGVVAFNIELPEGNYTVITEFEGDETYAPKSIENTLIVVPKETRIIAPLFEEFTTIEVAEGDAYVELTLVDIDGNPLVNQTVVIELDNVSVEFETDENGTIEYTIEALAGEYTIVMEFAGDEFYTESNATTEISIVPVESEIIAPVFDEFTTVDVAKGEAIIELTLFDIDGNPLAEQTVVIEVDNVSAEFTTDENGTIEYAVYDALAGNYTIVMTFAGDEIYAGSNATTEISIVPVESQIIAPVFVQVTAVDVAEKSAIIDISLTDIDGNPLAEKPVIIEFNGVGDDFITDENGTVRYSLWGDAGDYKLIVKFDGDSWYSASNATADVSIVLVESEILAPVFAQFTTVDVAEGNAIINITLTDIDENPLANKTVFIGIDGGEGEYTTDENGAIQLLVLANAGEHTIAIEFAGDACYGASNATTEVSIVPVESQIVAPEYAEYTIVEVKDHNATFDLTLVDEEGNPLANKDVIIELNGVGDHFTTDENGAVKYSLWGDAGNYTLIARFEGDERYTKSNATANIVITPVKTEIVADESAVYSIVDVVSGNATFDLTLVDADGNFLANKTIFITFNGVTEQFTTDENGTVEYAISAGAGNYTIDMAFENDGYYEASDASATVSIVKAESKIFLRNALYFVLETKMVRITLWDGNNNPVEGKIVHITIGDSTWSGVTDKNGDAYIKVGIGFGVHAATVHFDGDDEYAASNRSGFVRVIKETPSVMVRGDNTHFKVSDATKTVKVYLWDRTSKPLPANSKIAIKVNGQTYVGYTDNTGVASINLDINTAGTYNAEVKYAGNSAYNAVTRDVKFVIQ